MKAVVIQETVLQPDLTPEEISARWQALRELPEVSELIIKRPDHYPDAGELHDLIGDAQAVFGIWISAGCISGEFLDRHPNLKYIATLGHGWEDFDVEMTRARGVTITNTLYGAQTVAEHAWALLMEVCHRVSKHSDYIKTTDWSDVTDGERFTRVFTPQIELYGLTAGIVGLGCIGLAFAQMARGFGMKVLAYSRRKREGAQYDFIEQVSFEELLGRSDVISLHAPYSASSANMINAQTIAKMKDGVILINTARGGLINEDDLCRALHSGKIYGAGLDVLCDEPPKADNPLLRCENAVVTGHIAWLTRASRLRACDLAVENFRAYLAGRPVSVIN